MARITVRFFGPARDLADRDAQVMELEGGLTVGQLAGRIAEAHPKLGAALGVRLAVNRAFVPMNHPLTDGDEIAVIPPVSGGMDDPPVTLTREPIDAVALSPADPASGAVVTFQGTVRAESKREGEAPAEPLRLVALEYEAYDDMAIAQMRAIRARAIDKFGVTGVVVTHRLGRIPLGEASIAVVVTSAHRAEAFDACRWIVDAVKTDVPIWKKNVWTDGTSQWVDPTRS
jgi:molybdopterin synthase catalytic subunit